MKPFSILRLSKPMTAAALAIALIGCNKQDTAQTDQQSAELANQRAELEAEKQKVALEKEEATKLRDESERLRAEAELRSAITKLTDQVEKSAATEAPSTEPIAKSTPDSSAENSVAPVANSDQEVDLPPLPDLAPLPPVTKDISYQPFYDELSDKGEWMDSTDYGYVWQPPVGNSDDWAPYTDGGWSYTDAGWAWDSNESFGHVCYHYGRWVRLRGIGWVWVPGRDWAPAWVSWRSSDDCIGWAPLPPRARWTSGVGIHSWVDGICHIAPSCYTFVTIQNICHRRCREVIIPRHECEHRYLHTRNVTNITEYKYDLHRTIVRCEGPAIDLVRKHLGSGLRENKIAFADFKHGGAISANETKLPGVLTMPQWQLAKGIAQNDKPKLIQKKLASTLEVINEPAKENRLAVRKLMAQEAQESLKQLPSRTKPSTATIATAPKQELNQTIRPGTSLPPVNANPNGPRKQEEIREIAGTPTKPGKLKTDELHRPEKPLVTGNDRPLPPVQTRLNPVKPAHQGNPAENPIASSSEPKREQETGPIKAPSVAGNDVPKPQGDNNSGDRRPNPGVKVVPDPANPTLPYPRDELHVAKNPSAEEMRKQQADRNKAIQEKLQQDAEDQSKRLHGQQGPTKLPPIVQNPPANQQQGPTKLPPIVQNPPVNQQQGPTKLPPVIMPPNQNGGGGNQNPAADTAAIRQKQAEEQSRKQEQEWAQRRAQAEQAQMSQKAEQAREAQRQQAQQNQQQQASVMRQRQENQQKQENDRQSALEAQRRQQDSADKQAATRMREQQIAQQQEAAARQRQAEQGRNQQAEDNRRQQQAVQAREQQEENNRRQQQVENARQQQAEMARRQEENSRREAQQAQREAAQRQQENAQRRAADEVHQRQQQQQQQQQENSRRQAEESNRRAQADAAERRQQEESSRRQQDESKNKKGR